MTQELATVDGFEAQLNAQMRHAELMSQADMIPDKFKNKPANVLVAREIANAMGETPWVTMIELYFVGNIPTFSAKYMRSRVRAAGHILRESFDQSAMTATCVIIRKDDPTFEHVIKWDKKKAEDHGLWGKGHWKKNPELMLKNRAVSECVREACNEVMGGVDYTPEEAEHIRGPINVTATHLKEAAAAPVAPLKKPIEAAGPVQRDVVQEFLDDIAKSPSMDDLRSIMADAADVLNDGYMPRSEESGTEEFEQVRDAANLHVKKKGWR